MIRNCNICNTEYKADNRYLNRGQGLTCSRPCGTILASQKQRVKSVPNTTCAWCQTEFYRKPSQKHSMSGLYYCCSEHQNFGANVLHSTGPSKNINTVKCFDCQKTIKKNNDKNTQRCRDCYDKNRIAGWLDGNNSITLSHSKTTGKPTDTKSFVKHHLIKTRGDKCEVCSWDERAPDGRSIIQMDHINGNCFDNRPENLKLLCPNHHAMTETYGSLNRGSGRTHRRKQV